MCRSKISIHIDVRYKKSYTVKKVPEVAAGMKNKILVIEDDRAISELLCMNLEAAGYETVAAYDGEEAQRLLLWHEDADMAVVDIMLPGKDGFALMEDFKKKIGTDMNDKEIVFSKSIKAGKRIYYLDVKKNRKDEMFLAITESKKVVMGEGDDSQVSFEKHKIFLYKEDFGKFMAGLEQAINFINQNQEYTEDSESEEKVESESEPETTVLDSEIKIDIDFE